MSRDTVNQWLTEMGDFRLDEKNTCALTSDEGITIFVEIPEGSEKVFVYVPLAPLGDSGSERLLRYALELNLALLHTGGPALAADSFSGTLLLAFSQDVADLDGQTFQNVVSNLAELAVEFAGKIHAFLAEGDAAAAGDGGTAQPVGMRA
jgi:hypothetical protein